MADTSRHHALNMLPAVCSTAKHSGKSGGLAGHPTAEATFDSSEGNCEDIHTLLTFLTAETKTISSVGAYLNMEQSRKPKHKLVFACLVRGFAPDMQLTNPFWHNLS